MPSRAGPVLRETSSSSCAIYILILSMFSITSFSHKSTGLYPKLSLIRGLAFKKSKVSTAALFSKATAI